MRSSYYNGLHPLPICMYFRCDNVRLWYDVHENHIYCITLISYEVFNLAISLTASSIIVSEMPWALAQFKSLQFSVLEKRCKNVLLFLCNYQGVKS